MPSQAYSFFRESEWNFVRGYRDEIIDHINDSMEDRNNMIGSWLSEVGYKVSRFEAIPPFSNKASNGTENQLVTYGIYHAPKGDDTEAMVLVAPWKTLDGENNINGLALSMGLARYFNRLSIWSKNIIVVFPENGQDTLRSWVDAYHSNLDQTGGSIESAVILEFASDTDGLDYIELNYAGVNGQLPNLDLINCAVMISEHEGFKVSVHNTPLGQLWANDYFSRITTLLKGIYGMATAGLLHGVNGGGGNGCEAFSGWNVQTITIIAKGTSGKDITTLGRVLEAVFRSVNNLLEKFHQSFFFYLLLAPRQFVSIGNYLPAAVLTATSFAVASLSSLMTNNNINNPSTKFNIKVVKLDNLPLISGLLVFMLVTFTMIVFGLFMIYLFSNKIQYDELSEDIYLKITYGLIAANIGSIFTPYLTRLFKYKSSATLSQFVRILNSFSLFYLTFSFIALMVLHFSLSFLISIVALPLTFVKYGPLKRTTTKNVLWLFLSSPFTWLFLLGLFNKLDFQLDVLRNLIQYFEFPLLVKEFNEKVLTVDLTDKELWMGPVDLLYGLVTGYVRLQNWTWLFVTFAWLPVWFCTLIVSCINVETSDVVESDLDKKDQ
ncbi:hypothetical protein CANARDRAFT_197423 [[Candida] arabinofermentans NRRL YB-2248]|uniref:GPI transamidase component GAA1 n=1 Tax=[Candida] arabinofermentans NRRL YB-2248 TaxID=983967 RepID=A0A1E4T217_9ASCO|nr:hypothetical protein CANARDRAFT_197423 [[Candida] arabinofermentans NRRL YB-2248]